MRIIRRRPAPPPAPSYFADSALRIGDYVEDADGRPWRIRSILASGTTSAYACLVSPYPAPEAFAPADKTWALLPELKRIDAPRVPARRVIRRR